MALGISNLPNRLQKKYLNITNKFSLMKLVNEIKNSRITSDTIYLFSSKESRFYTNIFILLAYELSKQGRQSFLLFKNSVLDKTLLPLEHRGIKVSNSLKVLEKKLLITSDIKFEKEYIKKVSCKNELIEIDGINFFLLVRSNLRSLYRRYNINWENKRTIQDVKKLVNTCELLLNYFKLLKEYSEATKTKIRIVGVEASYIPNSVFRFLCSLLSDSRDLEYIEIGRGYMQYFGHHFRDSFLSTVNSTYQKLESRHTITKKEFDEFKKHNLSNNIISSLEKALNRMKSVETNEKKLSILKRVNEYRSQKKPVFVLFAHVFFDTGIDDSSISFPDMCTWIVETIKHFYSKDALLLLKPHPSEIKKNFPNKEPNEKLLNFLEDVPLSSNIVLLDPDLFTLNELREHISVGLIWRSSAALELACFKVPVIIAGRPTYNVLNLTYAESRSHYFEWIDNYKYLSVSEELKLDSLKYIHYFEKYKNNYIECIKYDIKHNIYYWDRKALKNYLRNGNREIQLLVSKITS